MIKAPHIYFKKDNLMVEGIMVEEIIDKVGTPAYIYSKSSFIEKLNQLKDAFTNYSTIICYSVKVCHNTNIIKTFASEGCGADIVSGGELYRALKVGVNPRRIVYSGVGKTDKEIVEAINADILMFNVESEQELERLNLIGKSLKRKVPVSIRVNPDVDAKTHPYITTGIKENKFGIDSGKVIEIFKQADSMSSIEVCGIDLHIGSQLLDPKPYGEAMKIAAGYVKQLKAENIDIKYVDVGGGLGVSYKEEHNAISIHEYASMITEPFKDFKDITFILEPGRFLTAEAGMLVTKVQYVKENLYGKRFLIVDTGMHHLIRPPLYGGYHSIIPVRKNTDTMIEADVVGPICESTDFLGKERLIEKVCQNDLLAVTDAGAYGIVLASHYNSHSLPVEVLVDGSGYKVIRRRETYEDLLNGEVIDIKQAPVDMGIKFSKYSALGNDYIVIDPNKNVLNLNPENIKRICDRNFGAGSDGILYGPEFKDGKPVLRIFNPDGSEAEKSGNGIRIFARYLKEKRYVNEGEFEIITKGGNVYVSVLNCDNSLIKVDMGDVSFYSTSIPMSGEKREVIREQIIVDGKALSCTCLTIGNPHCIVEMTDISKDTALKFGSLLENHELFPNRINVQFMKIIDRNNIKIEIWERGAGYTLASGSSSCAAASAAFRLGLTENDINVHMPGGTIKVEISENGNVFMTGSVDSVYEGEFSKCFEARLI